jgi:hypothetical protein
MTDISAPFYAEKHNCQLCDFKCCKSSDMKRHFLTAKHQNAAKMLTNVDAGNTQIIEEHIETTFNNKLLVCSCGKEYKHRQSLFVHRKKCKPPLDKNTEPTSDTNSESIPDLKSSENLIQYLLKENSEFKNLIMELVKKDFINNSNNNTINNVNSHNKSFCLNVFLNDTCKGAMNMSEFVDTIKIQMSDLENFAHMDYPDGVSKILLKNLNNLDINLRPIHCSDLKRETVYIKENDEWTKESDDKPNLKNAIKQIAFKNIKHINEWVKEHPGCRDPTTKQNVKYNKIVMNSMSGTTKEEQQENIEKIVKNVTKAVTIDKSIL